jgi:curli biogenesis system outer membrane secretion channel CsgG
MAVRAALILLLALTACATVHDPVEVQPESPPSISPVLEDLPEHHLKRRVVIARFSNETPYGKSVLLGDKKSLIGQMTSDILASRLTEAGMFLLFERSDSEEILDAMNRGTMENLNLPADFVIVGSLSEFGRNTTGETGVFSRTKVQQAYARVNIRLVDVRTGQVIFAEEGKGEAELEAGSTLGIGTTAGYDSTLDSKAISAAVSKLVSNLVENLLAQPWQSYVLSREGENLIIGGGASQGLKPGDKLALIKRGKAVKNPQTGVVMELPGERVAVLEVVSTFGNAQLNEGSVCRVVSGTAPEAEFSRYVVEEMES